MSIPIVFIYLTIPTKYRTWLVPSKGSFTLSDGNGNGNFIFFPSWMGLMESNGGCSHGGGVNGNGNDVVMEWVGYPFCSGSGNGNIYVLGCCHCHCRWCPPIWTLTTENKVTVAVAVTQCERTLRAHSHCKGNGIIFIILMSSWNGFWTQLWRQQQWKKWVS